MLRSLVEVRGDGGVLQLEDDVKKTFERDSDDSSNVFHELNVEGLLSTSKCCTNVLKYYCCASLRVSSLLTGFKHLITFLKADE